MPFTFKEIHQSMTVRGIVIGLGIAIIALGLIKFGMIIGYHQASFEGRYGDRYARMFVGPGDERGYGGPDMMHGMMGYGYNSHGAAGEVVSVSLPTFVVADADNVEKTVHIDRNTLIRKYQNTGTTTDITTGSFVVVLGNSDSSGVIDARLIRFVPAPPGFPSHAPTSTGGQQTAGTSSANTTTVQ